MLHPVGPLPARVYWRRRLAVLAVLAVLLVVLGAGVWGGVALLTGGSDTGSASGATEAAEPAPTPALERVVPSLTAVRTPAAPAPVPVEEAPPAPEEEAGAEPVAAEPGGPCTDDLLTVEVRTPGSVPVGTKPVLELVVVNDSSVPCVRDLDKALQELIMLDSSGARVWGSNDCFPEAGADVRTLEPGVPVVFPVVWGGRTSAPDCAGERTEPTPGDYAVRGRLDTASSPDAPLTLT